MEEKKYFEWNENKEEGFGLKGGFEEQEGIKFNKIDAEKFTQVYDIILNDKELFLGNGNHAVVYMVNEGDSEFCIKNIWKDATTGKSDQSKESLPEELQGLRNIQDYFKAVLEKKSDYVKAGYYFHPQNSPIEEATITNRVNLLFKDKDIGVKVPWVQEIFELERSSGFDLEEGETYFSEDVVMLNMDVVDGFTLQQMILGEDVFLKYNIDVNPDDFEDKLLKAVDVMHDLGIYHNDLTIRNIMIDRNGVINLIDFGGSEHSPGNRPNNDLYETNVSHAKKIIKQIRKYNKDPEAAKEDLQQQLDIIR